MLEKLDRHGGGGGALTVPAGLKRVPPKNTRPSAWPVASNAKAVAGCVVPRYRLGKSFVKINWADESRSANAYARKGGVVGTASVGKKMRLSFPDSVKIMGFDPIEPVGS